MYESIDHREDKGDGDFGVEQGHKWLKEEQNAICNQLFTKC